MHNIIDPDLTLATLIYVINLAHSTERKKFITAQFDKLNQKSAIPVSYSFFEAVNGRACPNFYLFQHYNEQKRLQVRGNKLSLPQLGCWASHYLLWEKCVELNQPIIVLEDDAILNTNFAEVYKFISSPENHFAFLWLGKPSNFKENQKRKTILDLPNTHSQVVRFYHKWANTVSYFITPQAAKKLLAHCSEWIYEVDTQMERYWETNIPYLGIFPFCIEQDLSQESNISQHNHKAQIPLRQKLIREYHRTCDQIRKFFFDLIKG